VNLKQVRLAVLAAAGAVSIACTTDEPTVPSLPSALTRSQSVSPGDVPSGERLFAELSDQVPSASGFFFDAIGRIIVNVVDAADGPNAVETVRGFVARGDIAVPIGTSVPIVWRPVQYSYGQLSRWRNAVFDSSFTRSSQLVTLDLDERANRIRVGALSADRPAARTNLSDLFRRIRGDTTALEVVDAQPLRLSSFTPKFAYFTWSSLTANADTMVGGLAIGSSDWACTAGFTASHPSWGQGFVSASHCTADIWNVDGRVAYQHWTGSLAGTEVGDPGPWSCGVLHLCRRSDAAFFQKGTGKPLIPGLVTHPSGLGQTTVNSSDPYFVVVGESDGFMGQTVYKIGYSTGWTSGTLNYTCQDHNLTGLPGNVRTVRCTNESSNSDLDGDSGGSIILPIGGPYVYLAGTTIGSAVNGPGTGWSTISQIQLDYGNSLTTTRAPSLTAPSPTGTIPSGTPNLSWPSVSGATRYHVYYSTGGAFSYKTETSSTTFSDGAFSAVSVSSTPPSAPWVAYYVVASSPGNLSTNSSTVYFKRPSTISATIQGQFAVKPNQTCYWTANASGGTGSYSYQWTVNGVNAGTNSSQFSYSSTSSFTLGVTVTDGSSSPGVHSRSVSVSSGNPACML
jgi:hypothetical protein